MYVCMYTYLVSTRGISNNKGIGIDTTSSQVYYRFLAHIYNIIPPYEAHQELHLGAFKCLGDVALSH